MAEQLTDHLISNVTQQAAQVRLMIFDVDGILTDGSLHFGPEGEMMKTFNVLDGQGIKLLQNAGIATAIISARQSAIVSKRANDLGIPHVMQGIHDKKSAFLTLTRELNIPHQACGFIGDDVIDLPILLRVGFSASVSYVTKASGGRGAVREISDFILRAQNKYDLALQVFLNVDTNDS
jgi:3-deoxy-D-manno-octulosonate 8-phosphate phosphatase (KDO 8-P phosphatase)